MEDSRKFPPTRMEREYGAAQLERSLAFQRHTSRRGMPMTYGTGEPGACVPGSRAGKK